MRLNTYIKLASNKVLSMNEALRALFRKTEEAKTDAEYAAVAAKHLDNPSDYYQYRGYYFLDVDNPYFDPLLSEDAWKKAKDAYWMNVPCRPSGRAKSSSAFIIGPSDNLFPS